ncbi:MAG: D-alanine--D-alanine ligase [Candidatus Latescibacteria bacterium]|nr:D-alanine--D-alanine ligase [Candidatus Latescibacterota bacterium]
MKKIRVGLLFGGRSCEHEVSVRSARSVLEAIDRNKYELTMIGISKRGHWLMAGDALAVLQAGVVEEQGLLPVVLEQGGALMARQGGALDQQLDVIFPLLHGPFGEDGTVQGLLELAGIPYVGSGVVGSAVGMDKEMTKRAFRADGLPQVEYAVVRRHQWRQDPAAVQRRLEPQLAYPMFFKPANMGSSVGVCKAHGPEEFRACLEEAAAYDYKVVVEAEASDCREVECSVLGNEEPQASVVGEVVPGNEFYDYNAKYIDDNSQLIIPARLSPATSALVRELALRAFRAVEAAGLARVDFFVSRRDEQVYVNEINTLPGFTPISMYPKLWEASGVAYPALIDRLIQLALDRHRDRQDIRTVL